LDAFSENLVITNFLWEPSIDQDSGEHLNNGYVIPFPQTLYSKRHHLLYPDRVLYISTEIQKVEVEIDSSSLISDFWNKDYNIRQVSHTEILGDDQYK